MSAKYISAKLFFVLALACFVVGAALSHNDLPGGIYSNSLLMVLFPRLIPFPLAIISACVGLVYFVAEKSSRRNARVWLTLVQITFLLVGVFGHIVIVRFWWRVLGEEHTGARGVRHDEQIIAPRRVKAPSVALSDIENLTDFKFPVTAFIRRWAIYQQVS
jgi:hypothetical protein